MLRPKKLGIRGFRGISRARELDFDKGLVVLYGENHEGKSSAVNGIEWAFFGDACLGKQTGIRERVDWEIANRHQDAVHVEVEVVREADAFAGKIATAVQTRENDLKDKRLAAAEGGLTAADLSVKGAGRLADRAQQALQAFAGEAKLPTPRCAVPKEWKQLRAFGKEER